MIRTAALWLALMLPAAAMTIYDDHGGNLGTYADRFALIEHLGEQVVVAGTCNSACTLVLALRHVCVTAGARFGFHRAYELGTNADSPEGTAYLWAHYPRAVRTWLARHGGLTRRIKYMPGSAAGLPRCR